VERSFTGPNRGRLSLRPAVLGQHSRSLSSLPLSQGVSIPRPRPQPISLSRNQSQRYSCGPGILSQSATSSTRISPRGLPSYNHSLTGSSVPSQGPRHTSPSGYVFDAQSLDERLKPRNVNNGINSKPRSQRHSIAGHTIRKVQEENTDAKSNNAMDLDVEPGSSTKNNSNHELTQWNVFTPPAKRRRKSLHG
jgi:hypothetical protein